MASSTTGVFCRPPCDCANPPVGRVFEHASEALTAGFRPCRSCRPLHNREPDPDWYQPLLCEIEADPARRWHDPDLERLGLDSGTVRRWFVENHGVTFHAYCRLWRMGELLRRIQQGAAAEPVIAELGYESESDFREAFALAFGHPPSAVDRESCIWLGRLRTPLGSMLAGAADAGLFLLEFADRGLTDTRLKQLRHELGRVCLPGAHPLIPRIQQEIDAYFEDGLRSFTAPVRISGTAFQEQVWHALQTIPYGQTRSYSDIAHQVGHDDAGRAVGRATGDNRIALVLPCHRVVGSGGELVGYGGGLGRKRYLLALEQSEAFSLSRV
ncbi:bifunctional transcriptional activator/DNA repair enzyme AdaA [Elongatibacter sediminis]|uniref:methylated-DNA--[protein]-cysteine S-methyltransferase n=1 Tax=Elongatibacter sediminis TaxID=3119006 RepID=A0AAW9RNR1_9GAMM